MIRYKRNKKPVEKTHLRDIRCGSWFRLAGSLNLFRKMDVPGVFTPAGPKCVVYCPCIMFEEGSEPQLIALAAKREVRPEEPPEAITIET